MFANLSPTLKISPDYQPEEQFHPEGKGVEGYAPLHPYKIQARGSVEGPVDDLLLFYKKVQEYELIKEDQIVLLFES